ncbi:MAG: hypothetical protein LBV79_11660, partial [Candidatus Adiutrix sp.]|nr:hypothetical protein [Candidatus Adiutrix sp.]
MSASPVITQGIVLENRPLSPSTFLMVIDCPELPEARPGQFVKIRTWDESNQGGSPFLDRPFSIHRLEGGRLSLLYRVVGPATKIMSRAQVDSPVKVSGPLGWGTPTALKRNPLYLVGGGIGLAPMGMVLGQPGATAHLFYG